MAIKRSSGGKVPATFKKDAARNEDLSISLDILRTGAKTGMNDFRITDMDIQALVDKELEPTRERFIFAAIQRSPELLKRYTTYLHQKDLLKKWWKDN